jgi:hypothetical protein
MDSGQCWSKDTECAGASGFQHTATHDYVRTTKESRSTRLVDHVLLLALSQCHTQPTATTCLHCHLLPQRYLTKSLCLSVFLANHASIVLHQPSPHGHTLGPHPTPGLKLVLQVLPNLCLNTGKPARSQP